MHTVGLEHSFLAIWSGLFQRTELHTWEWERTTGEHTRGRGERTQAEVQEDEGGALLCPTPPVWAPFPQGMFLFVSPIGPWAPKRLPRSCLSFISSASSTGGEKCESTRGASTVYEHCTGRPSHPRDRAWVTERVRLELLDCYWAALGWCRYMASLDFTLFAFK